MLNAASVASQNPWWRDKNLIEKDEKVEKALGAKRARLYAFEEHNILLMGPRQVGKTTLVKLAIRDLLLAKGVNPRNVLYYSCESLSGKDDILELARLFEDASDKGSARYLFLDEISFVDDWNVAVLSLFNSGYMKGKFLYATGSSSISLQKETWPGREIEKRVLYPLGFAEYFSLFYKEIGAEQADVTGIEEFYRAAMRILPYLPELNAALESYLLTGGFLAAAEAWAEGGGDPFDRYYETYKDALLTDVAKSGRSEKTFRQVMHGVIGKYGSRYSANSIATEMSIGSHSTVEEYLDFAQRLFLSRTLYRTENSHPVFRSSKKTYVTDPFVYRVLKFYTTGVKEIAAAERPHVVEGVVGMHLVRRYGEIYYSATRTGKEVDFMCGGVGIEVKSGRGVFGDLHADRGFILTSEEAPKLLGEKASIPISIFLYLISSKPTSAVGDPLRV